MPAAARGGGTGEFASPAPGLLDGPQGFETVWLWRLGVGGRVDGLLVGAPGSLSLSCFSHRQSPPASYSQVLSGILRGMEPPRVRVGPGRGVARRPGTRACGLCGARAGGVSSRATAREKFSGKFGQAAWRDPEPRGRGLAVVRRGLCPGAGRRAARAWVGHTGAAPGAHSGDRKSVV